MTPEEAHRALNRRYNIQNTEEEVEEQKKVTHGFKKPETVKNLTIFKLITLDEDHVLITTGIFRGKRKKEDTPGVKAIILTKQYIIYDTRENRSDITAGRIKFQDGDYACVDFFYTWNIKDTMKLTKKAGNDLNGALNAIAELILSDINITSSKIKNYIEYNKTIYQNNLLLSDEVKKKIEDEYGIQINTFTTNKLVPSPETASLLKKPTKQLLNYEAQKQQLNYQKELLIQEEENKRIRQEIINKMNVLASKGLSEADRTYLEELINAFPSVDIEYIMQLYYNEKMSKNNGTIHNVNLYTKRR